MRRGKGPSTLLGGGETAGKLMVLKTVWKLSTTGGKGER